MRNRFIFVSSLVFIIFGLIFTKANGQKTNAKSITIGIIGKSQSNPVFIAAYAGARVAAKEVGAKYNVEVIIDWRTPQTDNPQEQAQAVEQLSQSGASGIAISCSDANTVTPFINRAVDNGAQVICFNSDAPKSKRFAYYGSDNAELGRMIIEELAREMNEKGVVAMIGGNKGASNMQRIIQAATEELKKYPSLKLLSNGVFYHDELPEKAAGVVNRAQKANPQIGGWAFLGGWPLFMKNGIKWEPGQAKIVACDALPAQLGYIKSGHVQVLIAQDCFSWGYQSVELLLQKILMNQTPKEEFIASPLTRVTKDNVEEWSLKWKKWLLKEAVNR